MVNTWLAANPWAVFAAKVIALGFVMLAGMWALCVRMERK